jgi:Protein of unknown function (DUF1329)
MVPVKFLATFCLGSLIAGSAAASIAPDLAGRLSQDLTPLGAELAGNSDGTIPQWNAVGTPVPAAFVAESDDYINPYAGETPLYTIDADNWQQYSDTLTVGSKAMLEKLGAHGYRMDVYPSKREFVTPDWYYSNSQANAASARLIEGGQKVEGNLPGVPFPIPQTGLEVMWNHMIRYATDHTAEFDTYYVSASGKPILSTSAQFNNVFEIFQDPTKEVGDTAWMKLRINYSAPARRAGEILLVHEPGADYTNGNGRKAWQYLTGQRRVRLAPAVSFDTPNPAVAGTSTYDDSFLYNGSPERFDWKLVGKQEMIVPYSNYDFLFQVKIEDALGKKFIKPEYIRWEKHRVWIVEADLKEGQRHLYSKRRFYIDEDTWSALASEMYDGRGQLWRTQFAYSANLYDRKSIYGLSYGAYDLIGSVYNVNAKPIPGKFRNGVARNDKYFTAKGMARGGIR